MTNTTNLTITNPRDIVDQFEVYQTGCLNENAIYLIIHTNEGGVALYNRAYRFVAYFAFTNVYDAFMARWITHAKQYTEYSCDNFAGMGVWFEKEAEPCE